jgi:hypothetical protein
MDQEELTWLVRAAGALHFAQIPGMAMTLKKLRLSADLQKVSPLTRRMMLGMAGGIVLCVIGTGLLTTLFAGDVVRTRLGFGLCCFGALFWGYRTLLQLGIYRGHWPQNAALGHVVLSVLFPIKTAFYLSCVALLSGA